MSHNILHPRSVMVYDCEFSVSHQIWRKYLQKFWLSLQQEIANWEPCTEWPLLWLSLTHFASLKAKEHLRVRRFAGLLRMFMKIRLQEESQMALFRLQAGWFKLKRSKGKQMRKPCVQIPTKPIKAVANLRTPSETPLMFWLIFVRLIRKLSLARYVLPLRETLIRFGNPSDSLLRLREFVQLQTYDSISQNWQLEIAKSAIMIGKFLRTHAKFMPLCKIATDFDFSCA